jgi:hypothetical protein
MPYKYDTLRCEKTQDGLTWTVQFFKHDSEDLEPAIGAVVTWAPPGVYAYVVSCDRAPDGPHQLYQVVAKTNSYIRKSEESDGTHYSCLLFLTPADSSSPVVGQLAAWAPTTTYVVKAECFLVGDYLGWKIEAKSINTVLTFDSEKGRYYSWRAFVASGSVAALPRYGTLVDWAPVDSLSRKAYLYKKTDVEMMGDGSYYVTMVAVEQDYDIGLESSI